MMQTASLEEVFESVANACAGNQKVSLLIGAGCSVTAGIPVASKIVERIAELFAAKHEAAKQMCGGASPNYQQCMARLAPLERRRLMAEYVDTAKINWAHIGIACLMRKKIVDRVLTVNFDPLVIRACALLNEFPGVYDFAASQTYDASHVAERAVFYLHGQQSGFVQLHTKEQVEEHAKRLTPVFDDSGRNRLWIVVGYSGDNDPVIDNLAKLDSFGNGLYWIGLPGTKPPESIANNLLGPTKSGFFVESAGADEFFIELARRNACFPPPIFATPFSHLATVYETLVQSFPTMDGGVITSGESHPLIKPRSWITDSIKQFEQAIEIQPNLASLDAPSALTVSAVSYVLERFLAGDYDSIISRYSGDPSSVPADVAEPVAWSYIMSANALSDQAKTKSGAEADRLFALSGEKYAAALAIKPDKHEALNNWGIALSAQAKTKSGAEADRLFADADSKFVQANAITPGVATYDRACICSLRGDFDGAREFLMAARDGGGLLGRDHLMTDSDMDPIRAQPWFEELLKEAT